MKLAAVFSDHAVLQRDIPIPVWGWTKPQVQVKARLGKVSAETRSGADGRFLLRLPPLAAGGPLELEVAAAGKSVRVRDVMIGEVWIASGQSNMQWTLSMCAQQGEEAIRTSAKSGVRMITIPRQALLGRQSDVVAKWNLPSPETAGEFSAVAFYFARKLHEVLKVPVGIIDSSWGGTIVETWTGRESLLRNPDTKAWTERYEATINSPSFWSSSEAPGSFRFPADPGNAGLKRGWAEPDCPETEWSKMNLPCIWQSAGHNYSGVFWFRLAVDLPSDWAGKELNLQIGAVDKQDKTYFNGVKVGETGRGLEQDKWNLPRNYTVPGRLVRAGRNVIAVRAYSFVYGGGMIGPAERMKICRADGKGKAVSLAGAWLYREERNFGFIQPPAPPMGPGNPNSPYMLYDNMISPLIPYALRGAIWYQGESNAGNAGQYRGMLTNMIRDWRHCWGQGDFTFLQVQLANYMQASSYQEGSSWARLREAQLQTLSEPNTGMAVIIDIGEAADIHPKNKKDVGHRLAQWALVKTYGRPGVASGPIYAGMTIEGSKIRLRFDNVGTGLVAQGGKTLSHFFIAGLDRRFVEAKAVIDGATVVVESSEVKEPAAVRYAWADNPEGCNFRNADGFPASPFRTDTW